MDIVPGELLKNINSPNDLKKLPKSQLNILSDELRQYIIDIVSKYGGHFGASLGVVELTVALHYVFNAPYDHIVWDVGHQAYGHKILTGRRDEFVTNRIYKGISGFPKRSESEFDAFGVGHSSTSISSCLGMALAAKYKKENRHSIAVIGDGGLTGGMAFEAMNHAGISDTNLLVILNDNNMSIDPNVGALKNYLMQITMSQPYNKLRDDIWQLLGKLPIGGNFTREMFAKMQTSIKGLIHKSSNLFEALNFRYFGPVDGHNVQDLADTLKSLSTISGPKLLHVITVKGKGFALAEKEQTKWHAPGLFDKLTGEIYKTQSSTPKSIKYQDVFGYTVLELARVNSDIMAITPAMPSGSSLKYMMEEMPHRALDVGICEQHAVTLSAGLATQGLKVFCAIYSTFLQRGYDQLIHDIAIQDLPVIFCIDRAGIVGEDGPTHHGIYDMAYLRCVPNMIVSAPMNEEELRNLMYTAQLKENNHPFAIRYPRGEGVMLDKWQKPFKKVRIGKGRCVSKGQDVAIISIGHIGNQVQVAIQSLPIAPAHYDLRFIKPLDEDLLREICCHFKCIITVEDGALQGGMGSAVLEFIADNHYHIEVIRLGIPDIVVEHGNITQLQKECGFDKDSIEKCVHDAMLKYQEVNYNS